ncbi:hypothetical protein F5I97DRAFT_1409512 [Phlebopus sp. FC_14]|nr:hypothetical protein F5I97DRAFT_1409512 [Phlebopus sp. FC_14]
MSVAAVESYLRVSETGIIAAAALLAFDYCLTFEREVRWVYGTKWTLARIHFTLSRYLPFVGVGLAIETSRVEPPSETNYCGSFGTTTNVVYYLCIILAEAMLIVRTYACWQRDKKILFGTCMLFITCMVVAIVVSQTLSQEPNDPVLKALNCIGVETVVSAAIQYASLIAYETGMLCLNFISFRRMKINRNSGHVVITLYRDGLVYIMVILVFSIINAVVALTASIDFTDVLNSWSPIAFSHLAYFSTFERRVDGNINSPFRPCCLTCMLPL